MKVLLFALAATAAATNYEGDADDNRKCHTQTVGYLDKLVAGNYVSNGFFDCFRTQEQIFEFLDTLQKKHPTAVSKFEVSKTFKGRSIPGYKLSNGKNAKAIYVNSMQHAREWAAGSSSLYTFAATLDDVANKKPSILDNYDLVLVPIVNLDSYITSWESNRYIRVSANGVDLNRNWPSPYWSSNTAGPGSETYAGKFPLSEPETSGIQKWLEANKDAIGGAVDVHSNAASVLYPFGDTKEDPAEPYLSKYKTLGKAVHQAIKDAGADYDLLQRLYPTYGNFRDFAFRNYTKPGITIEVSGDDFVVPVSTIRPIGKELYAGLKAYSAAAAVWNGGAPTSAPTPSATPAVTPSVTPAPTTSKPSC